MNNKKIITQKIREDFPAGKREGTLGDPATRTALAYYVNGEDPLKLSDLYGIRAAAEYLGISVGRLNYLRRKGKIDPIPVQWKKKGERISPLIFIYTRDMLERFKEKGIASWYYSELLQVYSVKDAAELLGVSKSWLTNSYHNYKTLPGRTIGKVLLFTLHDLEAFRIRNADHKRGPGHYAAKLTAEQVRAIRNLGRAGIAHKRIRERLGLDVSLGTISNVINRRTYGSIKDD